MKANVCGYVRHLRLVWAILFLTTMATVFLVACGGTSAPAVQSRPTPHAAFSPTPSLTPVAVVNVKILQKDGQYIFDPATLKIKVGTQVIWTNDSNVVHTVTSDTLLFNTDNLATNQVFTVTFTKPGTYPYYCNIHTYMLGTIVVTS